MTQKIGVEAVFKSDNFTAGITVYNESLKDATKETNRFVAQVARSFARMEKQAAGGAGAKKVSEDMKEATKETQKFGSSAVSSIGKVRDALSQLGVVFTVGKALDALRRFVDESNKLFREFDKGVREVFTLLPDFSEESFGKVSRQVLDLSVEISRVSTDVVPALYQSISAGVSQDNVFQFLEQANKTALAGATDLEVAVDGLTTAVNAYGKENITAAEASDLLFSAVQGGKTTFEELSRFLFNVAPQAAAAGVEFGEVAAAMATLTAAGRRTRVATTQLRQLILELSQEGKKASDVFERLSGLSFREFVAQGGNVQQALILMEEEANKLNIGVNDFFTSIQAGGAALGLTGQSAEKFSQELERASNALGLTDQAAEIMRGGIDELERKLDAVTQRTQILVGEAMVPARVSFIELKIAMLETVSALVEYRSLVDEITTANIQSRDSVEGFIAESQKIVNTASSFNLLEKVFAGISGQEKEYTEAQRQLTLEIAKSSGTLDEFIANMEKVDGVTVRVADKSNDLIVRSRGLSNIFFKLDEDIVKLLGNYELQERAIESLGADVKFLGVQNTEQAQAALAAAEDNLLLADSVAEVEEMAELAADAIAEFFVTILQGTDEAVNFNEFLLDFAVNAGATTEEVKALAESTGDYREEQLQVAKVMADAEKAASLLREEVAKGNITAGQASTILRDMFGAQVDAANAALELAINQDELNKEWAEASDERLVAYRDRLQEVRDNLSGLLSATVANKDQADLFATSIDAIGPGFVEISGLTEKQSSDFELLSKALIKAQKSLREYELGIKGASLTAEKRGEKLDTLRETIASIEGQLTELSAVEGELVSTNTEAQFSQEALNQALFDSAGAANTEALVLAELGVALGVMTEEQAEAALKAVVMKAKIEELGQAIAEGMPIEEAIAELGEFQETLDRDYRIKLQTGDLSQGESQLDQFDEKVRELDGTEAEFSLIVRTEEAEIALSESEQKLGEQLGILETQLGTIGESASTASTTATEETNAIAEAFARNMAEINTAVQDNIPTATSTAVLSFQEINAVGSEEAGSLNESTTTAIDEMATAISEKSEEMATAVTDAFGEMVEGAEGKFTELDGVVSAGLTTTLATINGFIPDFDAFGANLIEGIIIGANSRSGALSEAIAQIVEDALATAEATAEVSSPSKRTHRLAVDIMRGFDGGIDEGGERVKRTLQDFIDEMLNKYGDLALGGFNSEDIRGLSGDALEDFLNTLPLTIDELHELLSLMVEVGEEGENIGHIFDDTFGGTLGDILTEATKGFEGLRDAIDFGLGLSGSLNFFIDKFLELNPEIANAAERVSELDEEISKAFKDLDLEELSPGDLNFAFIKALREGDTELAAELDRIRGLRAERNALDAESIAQQERLAELAEQQAQLEFLNQQLSLLEMIKDAGLDPAEILGGIQLGLDADLPSLIDAISAAMQAIIATANQELQAASPSKVFWNMGGNIIASFEGGADERARKSMMGDILSRSFSYSSIATPPLMFTSLPSQVGSSSTSNTNNTVNFGDTIVRSQSDAELFNARVREVIRTEFDI